jgi:hypothetical protein
MSPGDVYNVDLTEVSKIAGAVLLSLGGGSAIVFACSSWLGKVWAARILENDRLAHARELEHMRAEYDRAARMTQGQIEKTTFVHRVQFETEFQALSRIWAALAKLRAAMSVLRPKVRLSSANETPGEELKALRERFNLFQERITELQAAVHHHTPFYPADLVKPLSNVIETAMAEQFDLATSGEDRSIDWYNRGQENFFKVRDSAEQIASMMRDRISRLSIV